LEFRFFLNYKNIGTEHGQFVTLQSPIPTAPKMLIDANNETVMLNPEPREESLDRGSDNYYHHPLLFARSFIWAQSNNPTSNLISYQP
jgi:hypothetical protein